MGSKCVPYEIFEFPGLRYLEIMCRVQIWSKTVENCSIKTDRTFWYPKLPNFHRPFFGQKLEICTLSHFRHRYATRICQIANVKNIRIRSYETSYFCAPQKGQYPKSGPNMSNMQFLSFPGGDTQKSCAQTKFEAKRLKIAQFMTDRTFWDPKLPHFHRPLFGQKFEICTLSHFRHHYGKRNCKFANVKNIRNRSYEASYFLCPEKRVSTPKVPKSVPYGIF